MLAGVLWLATVLVGMGMLWAYAQKPGSAAHAPTTWPAETRIPRGGRPVLVMLVHPHCPCTRASMAELARLMARLEHRVDAWVLFLKPKGTAAGWEKTDLRTRAAEIPGVHVLDDEDGREAALFGASTSGQALLYDVTGRLRFVGGITIARGHEGDSLGQALIAAAVADPHPAPDPSAPAQVGSTAVYGCALADPPALGKAP